MSQQNLSAHEEPRFAPLGEVHPRELPCRGLIGKSGQQRSQVPSCKVLENPCIFSHQPTTQRSSGLPSKPAAGISSLPPETGKAPTWCNLEGRHLPSKARKD